jgi:hypothetical protein
LSVDKHLIEIGDILSVTLELVILQETLVEGLGNFLFGNLGTNKDQFWN